MQKPFRSLNPTPHPSAHLSVMGFAGKKKQSPRQRDAFPSKCIKTSGMDAGSRTLNSYYNAKLITRQTPHNVKLCRAKAFKSLLLRRLLLCIIKTLCGVWLDRFALCAKSFLKFNPQLHAPLLPNFVKWALHSIAPLCRSASWRFLSWALQGRRSKAQARKRRRGKS